MKVILIRLRHKLGVSQQKIAERLEVSQRIYSYWEKGQRKPGKLSFKKIKKLAQEHLEPNELKLVDFYEEQLYGVNSKLSSGYSFLDIEGLINDYKRLQKRVKKLDAELRMYKQWYKDFKWVINLNKKSIKKKI